MRITSIYTIPAPYTIPASDIHLERQHLLPYDHLRIRVNTVLQIDNFYRKKEYVLIFYRRGSSQSQKKSDEIKPCLRFNSGCEYESGSN